MHQYTVDITERTCKIITAYKRKMCEPVVEVNSSLRKLFTCNQMSGAAELKHILVLSSQKDPKSPIKWAKIFQG